VIIGGTVRSFWHYQAPATTSGPDGQEEATTAGPAEAAQADAEDSRRAS
jgi:hypothetical protein